MNAIDFAPQWIGAPSRSRRPPAAKAAHVQPLPSMPMNVAPLTVPSGAAVVKLVLAKMNPSTPRASEAIPISATGPLASDTPRRGGALVVSVAMCSPPVKPVYPEGSRTGRDSSLLRALSGGRHRDLCSADL